MCYGSDVFNVAVDDVYLLPGYCIEHCQYTLSLSAQTVNVITHCH